ncbi:MULTISPECIES: GGDEF domain-containing protein [unclassified Undibacterium]|uniref:GGDEF domain-containing protein n=1 Tax=unclassified Undibacterium TaxID=2630295 RepID=UPI002AC97F2C|nr:MULTISPECIES: GGDEF domain-containing protein [unclassified Undibacterium]MEB0138860.1 GGDEF domain-containing protein [Undibacterium sp. CCC2.1]MEB0172278.1 GGDEF domain-containing protein [Undibacterium sp. CCC1.1]MEB0176105.1 GGDEF domain-containing protein [Undibacterium sp. CCC3.4]MEB0215934.1 GGDEF domain-containing protein [Undibacterium sp. 5I2]WPX44754.1 GGDEF domain-containing protein [Undibacterium sp. CCC3.4]
MPADSEQDQPLVNARQQLSLLIKQIKETGRQDNLLPTLETVLTQLEGLAQHDHLTGALNRRTLLNMLDGELARSYRTGHTFSFAVISVDGLELILEQHGQAVARTVLQLLGKEALTMLRTLDSFGRVAANEFAIVMPTTWLEQSMKAIARLKQRVAALDWDSVAAGLVITFSTGLTTNVIKDTPETMLQRANTALAQAKSGGPDRIVEAEAPMPHYDPNAADN